MYPINDRQYLKICAEIAKLMSISLSSAKKKVEIQIAKEGQKTIQEKIQVAQNVLKICEKNDRFEQAKIGKKRMGKPGASKKIVDSIRLNLLSQ